MSEPRRMPGRFAWLLPLAVFVLVLSLMASENPRPRKLRSSARGRRTTRFTKTAIRPTTGRSWSPSSGRRTSRSTSKQTSATSLTLGSRGSGPIRTVLLGSVSRTLVREGPVASWSCLGALARTPVMLRSEL
jgi:hypothetical protein